MRPVFASSNEPLVMPLIQSGIKSTQRQSGIAEKPRRAQNALNGPPEKIRNIVIPEPFGLLDFYLKIGFLPIGLIDRHPTT